MEGDSGPAQMVQFFPDASVGGMMPEILEIGIGIELLYVLIPEVEGLFEFRGGLLKLAGPAQRAGQIVAHQRIRRIEFPQLPVDVEAVGKAAPLIIGIAQQF